MPFEKGDNKGGGRKKGSINERTKKVKEAIELAFEEMGGVPALVKWGKANPNIFYGQVWPKLLPLQISSDIKFNQIIVEVDGDHSKATEPREDN